MEINKKKILPNEEDNQPGEKGIKFKNMDVRILIWTLILTHGKSRSMSVSGVISKDITFLHKRFPVPPSMRAIIEVDVSYPINSIGNILKFTFKTACFRAADHSI